MINLTKVYQELAGSRLHLLLDLRFSPALHQIRVRRSHWDGRSVLHQDEKNIANLFRFDSNQCEAQNRAYCRLVLRKRTNVFELSIWLYIQYLVVYVKCV